MSFINVALPSSISPGWAPINALGNLAVRLLDGVRHDLTPGDLNRLQRLWNLRGHKPAVGGEAVLAILHRPAQIHWLRRHEVFRNKGRGPVVVWIIDSFHEEEVLARDYAGVDLICITRNDEADLYRRKLGDRILPLNWGADVLRRDFNAGNRLIDIQRIGRQPAVWDDDEATALAASHHGMTFAGRPPLHDDPQDNQRGVVEAYNNSKYVVAHTNLVSDDHYTHRTKEYVTARWTDAIASGAVVAGVQPTADATFRDILWPGATLAFDAVDLQQNLSVLKEAVQDWRPENAALNRRNALALLDWRHSLAKISAHLSIDAAQLKKELAEIKMQLRAA